MRTYIIQSNDKKISQYERTLARAKGLLLKLGSNYHIIALKGSYYGEGFHTHKYTCTNGRIKRERLR